MTSLVKFTAFVALGAFVYHTKFALANTVDHQTHSHENDGQRQRRVQSLFALG